MTYMDGLLKGMEDADNEHRKIVDHPEFKRLREECRRLDDQNIPRENRRIQVSQEFYELRGGAKTFGFIIDIEAVGNDKVELKIVDSKSNSLVFSAEKEQ